MEESQQRPILPYQAQENTPSIEREPENSEERRFTKEEWASVLNRAWVLKEREEEEKLRTKKIIKQLEENQVNANAILPLSLAYKSAEGLGIQREYVDKAVNQLYPSEQQLIEISKKYDLDKNSQVRKKLEQLKYARGLERFNEIVNNYKTNLENILSKSFSLEVISSNVSSEHYGNDKEKLNNFHYGCRLEFNETQQEQKRSKWLKFFKRKKMKIEKKKIAEINISAYNVEDSNDEIIFNIRAGIDQKAISDCEPILNELREYYQKIQGVRYIERFYCDISTKMIRIL